MKINFTIVAPPYTQRSGGVMVMHDLCSALNRLGHQAGLVFITEGSQKSQNFKFSFSNEPSLLDPSGTYYDFTTNESIEKIQRFIQESCIIYPDIIKGNPLQGRNYATYVLGKPAFPIVSQFIIGYSSIYIENPNFLLYKPFITEYMNAKKTTHWLSRSLSLTYIGKGQEYLECAHIPGTVLIERDWPRDKQQLAALFRSCKYLFTWDTVSATNIDAALCGAIPILMHDLQIPRIILNNAEHGPYPNIFYTPLMDFNATPINSSEIDAAILRMQRKVHELNDSWSDNVSAFVAAIVNILKK